MARAKVPGKPSACVVLSTVGDLKSAKKLARALVKRKLAACVNIAAGIISIYRWQGKILEDREVLLVIKTERKRFGEIKRLFKTIHPYDVPELIALPIVEGSKDYLAWLGKETRPKSGK